MTLSPNVRMLDSARGSNVYLLTTNDGYTLIDTGYAHHQKAIFEELEEIQISKILITHHDIDHIGNMSALQKKYSCPVYVNTLELPYIYGEKRRSGLKGIVDRFVKTDVSAMLSPLEDATFSDITVIHTPGHTPGHSCFLFQDFLFTGDLFRLPRLRLKPSRKRMNWDTDELKESIRKTIELPFAWVCPAHFMPAKWEDVQVDKLQK